MDLTSLLPMLAPLINGVLVILIVQYLKNVGMGWLKVNAPWSLPIIAMFAGVTLTAASVLLSGLIGAPIDFSPIIAVLVGSGAIVAFDVKHAYNKMKLAA